MFGLLFTFGQMNLAQFIPHPSLGISLIINAVGVTIMYQLFWNKSIGKDTRYRAKPIWIPLVIGIVVIIPLIYFAISSGN